MVFERWRPSDPRRTRFESLAKLVGLLGFEPRTKGFTLTGRFPIRVDYLFTLPASN